MVLNKYGEELDDELLLPNQPTHDNTIDPQGEVAEELLNQDFTNSEAAFDVPPEQPMSEPFISRLPAESSNNDLMARREALLAQYKSLKPQDIYNDDDLREAQEARDREMRGLAIVEAAQGISSAVAKGYGGEVADNSKQFENFRKMAGSRVSNIKERADAQDSKRKALIEEIKSSDEVTKRDPSSRVSELMRKLAEKRGLKVPNDANAADLEDILTKIEKPTSVGKRYQFGYMTDPDTGKVVQVKKDTQTGEITATDQLAGFAPKVVRDVRTKEDKVFTPAMGAITSSLTGPKKPGDLTKKRTPFEIKEQLNNKQIEELGKVKDQFMKETDNDRNTIEQVANADTLINEALENPSAAQTLGAFIAKTFQGNKLTDKDVELYTGQKGVLNKLQDFAAENISGTISQDKADNIRKTLNVYKDAMEKSLEVKSKQLSTTYSQSIDPELKMGADEISPLIWSPGSNRSSSQKTIVKKGYNPKTNQTQIMYNDGSKEIVEGRR